MYVIRNLHYPKSSQLFCWIMNLFHRKHGDTCKAVNHLWYLTLPLTLGSEMSVSNNLKFLAREEGGVGGTEDGLRLIIILIFLDIYYSNSCIVYSIFYKNLVFILWDVRITYSNKLQMSLSIAYTPNPCSLWKLHN